MGAGQPIIPATTDLPESTGLVCVDSSGFDTEDIAAAGRTRSHGDPRSCANGSDSGSRAVEFVPG